MTDRMTPIQKFFTWGYKKYVLLPFLKGFSREVSCAEMKALQVQQAMQEKEVLRDRRKDH